MKDILVLSIIGISAFVFDVWSSAIIKKHLQSVKSVLSDKSVNKSKKGA